MSTYAQISAMGSYVPERILSNLDLEHMVDTNEEWILQRTGIRERRIAKVDEFTSDLCVEAVQDLMLRSGKTVDDVNFSIVSAGLTLPNKYGYLGGGVQSWYLGRKKDIGLNKDVLYPQVNLVQIFPK